MTDPLLTVCETCNYPHEGEACPNPACLANPSLSDATRELIVARREQYKAEQTEREWRQRMWRQSFGR